MNTQPRNRCIGIALVALSLLGVLAQAHAQGADDDDPIRQEVEAANAAARAGTDAARDWSWRDRQAANDDVDVEAADPNPNTNDDTSAAGATEDRPMVWRRGDRRHRDTSNIPRTGSSLVSIGDNSTLAAGERSDAVVSVFGSSTSSGTVSESVISVFGNTRVEGGEVGEASVAVLGDNYVNAPVHGTVVAVLGNVVLGPNANVGDNVVVIGGRLTRDPTARIASGVQQVMTLPVGMLNGVRTWLDNCMRYLRPLAFGSGLGWVWTIAVVFLALYVFLAIMFKDPLDRCVKTLQEHPGRTFVTSLLALLLTPVLYTVLAITIIGIAFIPIATFGIFIVTLFGKAVVLAWIGRGLLKFFDREERLSGAIAVLAGGAIVLLLYTVPVLGFLVYNILGFLAFGAVVYTLLLAAKERRANMPPPSPQPVYAVAGGPSGVGGGAPSTSTGSSPGAGAATSAFTGSASSDASAGYTAAGDPFTGAGAPGATGYASGTGSDGGAGGGPGPGIGVGGGAAMPPPPGAIPGVNEAYSLPRAGFWIRMLALAIDAVIIGIVLGAVFHHMGQLHMVLLATYGAIMWKLKGTTIGGLVCNLKVVRLDGKPVDWSTSIVRALGCFLSTLILFLGFIWIAFDEGRQAWHDKIAGTAVVRSPQGVSLL
jgi:uncharacterized RDD family membrane protein YckC